MKGVSMVLGGVVVAGVVLSLLPESARAPLPSLPLSIESPEEATVIFTGDLMFDRYIRRKMDQFGQEHTLDGVLDFLMQANFVAGNLEGPITSNPSVSQGTPVGDVSNMRFTFPTTTPKLLARYNFKLVSLGNNHMLDYGREGAEETKLLLREEGIDFIGDPLREGSDIVIQETNGIRLAFIGYNEFYGQEVQDVTEAIRVANDTQSPDAVIVLAHWGEEYVSEPPQRVIDAGRAFIEAGADLVVGTHPHVRQPFEDYQGGRIYYSLGNFVFDQYWNREVSCGMAVVAHFSKDGARFTHENIGMEEDGRTVLGCR